MKLSELTSGSTIISSSSEFFTDVSSTGRSVQFITISSLTTFFDSSMATSEQVYTDSMFLPAAPVRVATNCIGGNVSPWSLGAVSDTLSITVSPSAY